MRNSSLAVIGAVDRGTAAIVALADAHLALPRTDFEAQFTGLVRLESVTVGHPVR